MRVKLALVITLTLKGTFTSVGAQGNSMEPPRKPLSQQNFAMKFAPCTIKNHNSEKKVVPFQNGGQISDFYFMSLHFGRNLKNHFPKEIFR